MDDLNTIRKALSEAVNSPDEKFVDTINGCLRSDNAATRKAAVETLVELLDGSSDDAKARQEVVFKETALTFITSLLPVLIDAPAPTKHLFELIAQTSRPKEVVLALNEALQTVEMRIEDLLLDISDDEEPEIFNPQGINFKDLVQDILALILKTYAQVIPRMGNPKSTPTLLTMSEAVSSALSGLAESTPTPLARAILSNTCELVENSWTWTQTTSDKGGEQKTILFNLLCEAIARYTPSVDAHMFEKWFLDQHAKYAGLPSHDKVVDLSGIEVLEQARRTLEALGYGQEELQNLLSNRTGSPFATLASVTILARYEMSNHKPSTTPSLSEQMPALSAALSGSAIDAGLLKVFAYLLNGGVPDQDQATLLIELVMPLAAFPTAPTTQTALFKLIEAIVDSQPPAGKIQVLKQLLEPQNPFDSIRVQSIPILRSQLSSNQPLISEIMTELTPILYTIPTDPPVLTMTWSEIKATMYPAWFTECANLIWFVMELDHEGLEDIWSGRSVYAKWLNAVVGYYSKLWKDEASGVKEEDWKGTLILDNWNEALVKAQTCLEEIRECEEDEDEAMEEDEVEEGELKE